MKMHLSNASMKESDAPVCRCNDQIHFIACPGGPLHGKRCQVWSVGITLEAWGKELEAAGVKVIHGHCHRLPARERCIITDS